MPDILDLVEPTLLECSPPRRLPAFFLLNLIGEYLIARPLHSYLDPVIIAGLIASITMLILRVGPLLWIALILILIVRIGGSVMSIYHNVREDFMLLKHGLKVNAHVLGVRPCRDAAGNLAGAYVDCVIPLSRKRTSVGSVWMPDAAAAQKVGQSERLAVLCLAHAPGTWRLCEGNRSQLRYEPVRE